MPEESRSVLYANFVRYFADPLPPGRAIGDAELAELAARLMTQLPASYVQFMSQHGPVYCPTILRLTLAFELEHPDLRQFLPPRQMLHVSRMCCGRQLPDDLFVFATDCLGNPFCFRRSLEQQDDAPVFFLSPQHEEPENLGESFDDLLRWYVAHVRQVPLPLEDAER